MFDKLKKAFSSAARSIGQKEITEKVLDQTLMDLQLELLESDVAQEVVDDLAGRLKKELLGLKLEKGQEPGQVIEARLKEAVAGIFAKAGRLDLVEKIKEKKEARRGPFVIVFLGINGTGKTTTVAKMGNLLRKSGISVVVAAGDTHRAGAIEQLTQHAERLSLKVIAQRYGADPSAVGRDAVDYAKKHYVDAVLIDTAGRMQTSKNLMDEMSKIVRVVKPDVKVFVGDSLAGNDTINQAREFFQYTNFDGAILTKIDADAKGGSAISIAHITSKPIAYVGVGQGYDDIIPFDPDKFIESLFGSSADVSVRDLMSTTAASTTEAAHPLAASKEEEAQLRPQHAREEEKEEMRQQQLKQKVPAPVAARVEEEKPAPSAAATAAISAPPATEGGATIGSPLFRSSSTPAATAKDEGAAEQKKQPSAAIPAVSAPRAAAVPAQKPSAPAPLSPSSPPSPPPQPERVSEAPPPKEEKKSRFGFFGRKKDKESAADDEEEDKRRKEKEEEERKRKEQERRDEQEREKEKERQRREKEQKEKDKKKRKEDNEEDAGGKKKEEDEVVYLTDEDIEDLLK
jgi:fused signal recognition particle receptor